MRRTMTDDEYREWAERQINEAVAQVLCCWQSDSLQQGYCQCPACRLPHPEQNNIVFGRRREGKRWFWKSIQSHPHLAKSRST
jgi:hypothetical protein